MLRFSSSTFQKSNVSLFVLFSLTMTDTDIIQYSKGGRDESNLTIELESFLLVSNFIKPLHHVGRDNH
jgi:hypothetical protein